MEEATKRITKEQKYMLIKYLEEHSDFAHERFVNSTEFKSIPEQWDDLAELLNAVGGACKSGKMWKTAWVQMRSKAKLKFQNYKKALKISGCNESHEAKLTELDERIVRLMSKVKVDQYLSLFEVVPEIMLLDDEDEDEYETDSKPSSSSSIKNNTTYGRKRPYEADASNLEFEREILKAKQRKNYIAEAQVIALGTLNETLVKILERLPDPERS